MTRCSLVHEVKQHWEECFWALINESATDSDGPGEGGRGHVEQVRHRFSRLSEHYNQRGELALFISLQKCEM